MTGDLPRGDVSSDESSGLSLRLPCLRGKITQRLKELKS